MFPCTLGRHFALTASSLWATVGAKYISTCQTETSISGAVMLVYSRERWGNPLKTCGKTSTSHTAVSRKLTSAHSIQPERFSIVFRSMCDKTPQSALQKARVKLERRMGASPLFPLERTRVKHLHHWNVRFQMKPQELFQRDTAEWLYMTRLGIWSSLSCSFPAVNSKGVCLCECITRQKGTNVFGSGTD